MSGTEQVGTSQDGNDRFIVSKSTARDANDTEAQQTLAFERLLRQHPFEPDPSQQQAVRAKLFGQAVKELPKRKRRWETQQRLAPVLRTVSWVAALALLAFGLTRVIGLLPGGVPGAKQPAGLVPTNTPAEVEPIPPSDPNLISEQEAMQTAVDIATHPRPGIEGVVGDVSVTSLTRLTYKEALARLTGSEVVPSGVDLLLPVWMVEMEGEWAKASPQPAGAPTQAPYHCYTVILNAQTGESLATSAKACPPSDPSVVAAGPTAALLPTPTEPVYLDNLNSQSPHQEIRERMTRPAWNTLWVEGQVIYPSSDSNPENWQVSTIQAWLSRDESGRVIATDIQPYNPNQSTLDLVPRWTWISLEGEITSYDATTGDSGPAPVQSGIIMHPLENVHPVIAMLFPSYLSLLSQDVEVQEEAEVAGRPVLVVDWGDGRYWVDRETGILLASERSNPANGAVSYRTQINKVVVNPEIPDAVLKNSGIEAIRLEEAPEG